jgi:predicted dehydrogenase
MGTPVRITAHEGRHFRWPIASADYFTADTGNHLLWDIGSHILDLLVWWIGRPDAVTARDDAMGGAPANVLLELSYADGTQVEVRLSRDCDLPLGIVVEGPLGRVSCGDIYESQLEWEPSSAGIRLSGVVDRVPPADESESLPPAAVGFGACFSAQLRDVVDAVRGRGPLSVPASSVVESIAVLAAAAASSELLESPWLSANERDRVRLLRSPGEPVPR